ncbi:MAG: tRNA (adenosine(37)-N6)-threonylcarbamoyltransferase complex dimerization subunit type 1 TsaB [Fimbriimonadales bacterium]
MIIAVSTSSPQSSVALLSDGGSLLWSGSELAPHAASGACIRLLRTGLEQIGMRLADVAMVAADLGPGSFTGVRVGVTLAKSLAYVAGAKAAGAEAFDLIDPEGTVVLPSRRGEWFVRRPGSAPERLDSLPEGPFAGFGIGVKEQTYPEARRFASLVDRLCPIQPELLVPAYHMEPSISMPKKPYGVNVG